MWQQYKTTFKQHRNYSAKQQQSKVDFQSLKTKQIFQYMVDKKILHFHKYNIFFDKFFHLKKIDNFNKSWNIIINVEASIVFFVTNICNLVKKMGAKCIN